MNPKISVIMPSLNVARYISKCLESVISQTLREIEIICIDAGSTDGTLEILKCFTNKDKRIKLIITDKKSYGYQVNLGLKVATGDYIAILETDDFVDAEMYSELFATAIENQLDFVKSYYYNHNNGKDILHKYENITVNSLLNEAEIRKLSIVKSIWSALYKREFLVKNEICFLETPGASYQDTSFIFKVAVCAQRVILIDRAFYHYRNDNPDSSIHSADKVYCVCDEIKEIEHFIDKRFPGNKDICELLASFRFYTYIWNYQRLKFEDQREFLNVMQQEMLNDWDRGYLQKSNFKAHFWTIIIDILFNKEKFLRETSKIQVGVMNNYLYREAIIKELSQYKSIIIYGAGYYGNKMLSFLRRLGIEEDIIVFAISEDVICKVGNRPCRSINSWRHLSNSALVIIAVQLSSQLEMYENVVKLGFKKILIMDNIFEELVTAQIKI